MNEFFIGLPYLIYYILMIFLILTWQQMHFLKKDVRALEKDIRFIKYGKKD